MRVVIRKEHRFCREESDHKADAGFLNPVSASEIHRDLRNLFVIIHQRFDVFFRRGDRCYTVIFLPENSKY